MFLPRAGATGHASIEPQPRHAEPAGARRPSRSASRAVRSGRSAMRSRFKRRACPDAMAVGQLIIIKPYYHSKLMDIGMKRLAAASQVLAFWPRRRRELGRCPLAGAGSSICGGSLAGNVPSRASSRCRSSGLSGVGRNGGIFACTTRLLYEKKYTLLRGTSC